MASTNKTSNLELSQFIATDTPTWLVDYNGDMEKIDAGVGRVEELAETASTQAVGVASGLQATNQTVTTLSGQVANVQNQANTTTASVNGINNKLGNADISGIGDGTITGAISTQNSNLSNLLKVVPITQSLSIESNVENGGNYNHTSIPNGYTCIGCVGVELSNTNCSLIRFGANSNVYYFTVRNISAQSITLDVTLRLLCFKNI